MTTIFNQDDQDHQRHERRDHRTGLVDEELVALCRGGDREAFGAVVARYQSLVCALTYAGCGDVHRSEDVAQETFLRAWERLGDLREAGRLRAWLCGIARNLLAGEQRRRGEATAGDGASFGESVESAELAPPEEAMRREERALLWDTLERLPVEYREPLVLFYRHEESVAVVAEALELSEDAARQRLSRGRAMLARRLEHIIHRGLRSTGPTQAFTLAVMASLPGAVVVATAATVSASAVTIGTADATAKTTSATAVATAGWLAWLGALAFYFYYGYKMAMAPVVTAADRRFVRWSYWSNFALIGGFSLLMAGVILWANVYRPTAPMWTLPVASVFLLYAALVAWWMWRNQRAGHRLRQAAMANDPLARAKMEEFCTRWNAAHKEYKSRWTLLGLPLIHINLTLTPASPSSGPVAKGWIAIGFVVYGALFAFGGIAVGAISFGGLSVGLLAVGALAIGAVPWGAMGVGIWALGAVAIGWKAAGQCALAWHSAAAGALAMAGQNAWAWNAIAIANHTTGTDEARHFFLNDRFFQFFESFFEKYISWVVMLIGALMIALMARELKRLRKIRRP